MWFERYIVRAGECSGCNAIVNDARHIHGPKEPPSAGDFALCGECGQLNVFTHGLKLRRPEPAEVKKYLSQTVRIAA